MKSHTKSFIIDCEIVAWDIKKKKILPFQILSTRKRKDVNEGEIQVKVQLFPFDMLYYNGKSLMQTEFIKRRELLHQAFEQIEGVLQFSTFIDGQDEKTISKFLPQAINDCCEGLMAKPLYGKDSYYVPDKRKWIKLKKDYMEGAGDTMDLVILAAWNGAGKRTGVYGTYLYFCYDAENEQYQSMTRIGTGYSDQDLKELHTKLQEYRIDEPLPEYAVIIDKSDPPDHWFLPKLVGEIKCADLTTSSDYMAAYGLVFDKDGQESGVGLRFPRFLRLREDKPPTAATGPEQIRDMYYNQSSVQK
jgi:DNA ligase-1